MSVSYTLADIHQEGIGIAIAQQTISEPLKAAVAGFLSAHPRFKTSTVMALESAPAEISQFAEGSIPVELAENIAGHVAMFCSLFAINTVEVNLTVINDVMCPRFHADRVPCRLITSYCGPATEWLPHSVVDRSKLGLGSDGLPDHLSGLYLDERDIQQLSCGDVALLKGTLWPGNENAGQVHRSPVVEYGERRLLLTLDFKMKQAV